MFERIRKILGASAPRRMQDADEQCRLAQAEQKIGRVAEAKVILESILSMSPGHWDATISLAALSIQIGDFQKAIDLYDEALRQRPQFAESYYKRANAYNRLNQFEHALADYGHAIAIDPNYAFAFCNRGTVLEKLGRLSEALANYDQAIALNPRDAFAHYNRASVLKSQAQYSQALQSYDHALALNGAYVEAHINRGSILQEQMRYEEALLSFDKALSFNAGFIEPWEGKASCLVGLKRLPEAIAAYDSALSMKPDQPYLRGLRRYARMQICDWQDYVADLNEIELGLRALKRVTTPFAALSLFDSPHLHQLAAQIWVADACAPKPPLEALVTRSRTGKIRVGYFSPDFRYHPVSLLLIDVLERHDRTAFEVVGFDFGPLVQDGMHARLRQAFDRFENVRAMSDRDLAQLARTLNIDIAIDLTGYTEHNRATVFSFRAAPVQLAYLGYPGTTANAEMDHILVDRQIVPDGSQENYVENCLYLSHCVLPVPKIQANLMPPPRRDLGLPSSGFIFCCFNNSYKINPMVFDVWMRILGRVEAGVLWLSKANETASENLRGEARRRGVDPQRLIFAERTASHADHLARLGAADLFLDTSPYSAHATAIDALSAGVPMVTCPGESFASRIPASLLVAFGLPELITESPAVYENLAVELALDRDRLRHLTHRLVNRTDRASDALDLERYTREVERIYRDLIPAPPR